ncbi:TBCC domain-containing protein 1, partial [Ananas comosus]
MGSTPIPRSLTGEVSSADGSTLNLLSLQLRLSLFRSLQGQKRKKRREDMPRFGDIIPTLPSPLLLRQILTLAPLKDRLLQRPIPDPHRVDAPALADALQIPLDHARLALDTLAAVLPAADPAIADGAGAADARDLLLFLYIQSYKRLVPRGHKDSVAVADVWPHASAFDGYLSALSPIQAVKIEHCERVQIITAAKRICIANCRECCFFLGINHQPLIVGDNHKLQVAPFNTYYAQLGEHMAQVGVDPTINKWDQPFVLGAVDPHDSLSHPAGVSDAQAESATSLDPDLFTNFVIPSWFGAESSSELTKYNPFPLPEIYWASQKKKHAILDDIHKQYGSCNLMRTGKGIWHAPFMYISETGYTFLIRVQMEGEGEDAPTV